MRVYVVDDHEVVRAGLRAALSAAPDIEIVGESGSGAEALRGARQTQPDVMLVDFRLPDMTGDEVCRRVKAEVPGTEVVILTTYLSEDVVQRSLQAGADFVTKEAGLGELRRALENVGKRNDGEPSLGASTRVFQRLHNAASGRPPRRRLTPQQHRILELLSQGLAYKEIGGQLHISESTVRFHVQNLKEKLGVRTRSELVAVAIRSALIAPDGTDGVRG